MTGLLFLRLAMFCRNLHISIGSYLIIIGCFIKTSYLFQVSNLHVKATIVDYNSSTTFNELIQVLRYTNFRDICYKLICIVKVAVHSSETVKPHRHKKLLFLWNLFMTICLWQINVCKCSNYFVREKLKVRIYNFIHYHFKRLFCRLLRNLYA